LRSEGGGVGAGEAEVEAGVDPRVFHLRHRGGEGGVEAYYQLPFERFERYCPYGTAEDVAEFLAPYVAAGCAEFNLIPQSPGPGQAIAGVAAVKKLLARA
jgi:hypothetical protein